MNWWNRIERILCQTMRDTISWNRIIKIGYWNNRASKGDSETNRERKERETEWEGASGEMVGRVRRKEKDREQMALRRRRSLAKCTGQDAARLQGQGRFTETYTPRHHSFDIAPDLEDPSRFNHDFWPRNLSDPEYVSTQMLCFCKRNENFYFLIYNRNIIFF